MFLLTSKKKDFITSHIISLLSSNTDYLTDDEEKNVFKKIYIENSTDNIRISSDEVRINIKKPFIYNNLHSNLFSLLSNTFFEFNNFIYYPLLQK